MALPLVRRQTEPEEHQSLSFRRSIDQTSPSTPMTTFNVTHPGRTRLMRHPTSPFVASCVLLAGLASYAPPAHAVDGCLVLLCFAAPSWRAIPECVPPVQTVLRDLALGRPFPTCAMSGPGNSAEHRWASAPSYCPPQYTRPSEEGSTYLCDYIGAVAVQIDNALWTRTWWSLWGDTVTEYSPTAKQQLGTWDPRFDNDYAAWQATQNPEPPCEGC